MNSSVKLFVRNQNVQNLIDKIRGCDYSLFCGNATINHSIMLASSVYEILDESVLFVCSNTYQANRIYDTFCQTVGYDNVCLYIIDDVASTEAIISSNELRQERLNSIKSIIENKKCIIVTNVEAALRPLIPLEKFKKNIQKMNIGDDINIDDVIRKLVLCGYERTHTTYKVGDFSVRGEVLDPYRRCGALRGRRRYSS